MRNFWNKINTKWDGKSIGSWSSLKKAGYILFPLFIYFLAHDMVEVLLWGGLNLFMARAGDGAITFLKGNAYTVRGIVSGLAILCGTAVIWKGVAAEIKSESGGESPQKGNRVISYMVLGALAILSALGLNLFFHLIGFTGSSESFTRTAAAQFGVDFAVGLLLYGILSPFAEEAVFRGLIFNRMKRCFSYPIAMIVSSLLFGCYHGNSVQAVYGTLLGLLIAYVYDRYESFAAPVLFHAVSNVSIYTLTYGNSMEQIGRNGSIVMTAAALLGTVGCLVWMEKKIVPKNKKI